MLSNKYQNKHPHAGPPYRCKKCKDVIRSMHRHDFRWCKCRSIAIDGGNSYVKLTGDCWEVATDFPEDELASAEWSHLSHGED